MWLAYHLLHNEAEKYVKWSASKVLGLSEPRVTNIEGVLAEMEENNQWLQAREWAEWNGLDVNQVENETVEDSLKGEILLCLPLLALPINICSPHECVVGPCGIVICVPCLLLPCRW